MFMFEIISVPKSQQKYFLGESELMGKFPEKQWITLNE